MSIQDIIEYLKGLGVTTPLFPLVFPASAPKRAILVDVGQGFSYRGDVNEIVLTFTTKAEHPSESEKLANELIDLLNMRTDTYIGKNQVIILKLLQLIPNYLGESEGSYYHMLNFKVLVSD